MILNKKNLLFILLVLSLSSGCDMENKKSSITEVPHKSVTEYSQKSKKPDLEIYIDLSGACTGQASILMILQITSEKRPSYFIQMGKEEEFQFQDVKFYGNKGKIINYQKKHRKYLPDTGDNKEIFISYSVKPGGRGRHGRQGNISESFASFDGRIFILPDKTYKINMAKIQFTVPDKWKIINPHRREGNWYYPDNSGKDLIYESLVRSPVACGPFDEVKKRTGNTDVYVYSYSKWPSLYRKKITEKSFKLYEYFHKNIGLDPGFPYIICWTPLSYDRDKVIGGIWSNGMCYEMEEDTLRNWELFAHRTGHAINEYEPTGMAIRDREDFWFIEGWASYIEIESTSSVKFADNITGWEKLYDHYIKTLEKYPHYDYTLGKQYEVENGDSVEFIHYTKAPLVMKMLDVEMKHSSGKTMEQFIKYSYKKYGNFKESFPFKEELEKFSGTSFEYFYESIIRKKGTVRPVWRN
jgi:hypothetical protein